MVKGKRNRTQKRAWAPENQPIRLKKVKKQQFLHFFAGKDLQGPKPRGNILFIDRLGV